MTDLDFKKGEGASSTPDTVNASVPSENRDMPMMIEIRGGKVVFKQKAMSLEKITETMQELVKFRELLEQIVEKQGPALTEVPAEHQPLIAKLVHESDKPLVSISKYIQRELLPMEGDHDSETTKNSRPLPLSVIEAAVKHVATRVNYGIDAPQGGRTPPSLCVWRWEVKPEYYDWLPKVSRDKADARLAERVQAKKDVRALFAALPQTEQESLLGVKASTKHTPLTHGNSNDATSARSVSPSPKSQDAKLDPGENENDDSRTGKAGRPKKEKAIDPEKAAERAAKDKERLEKKAAKAEKEKKEKDAQEKSRSIMSSFFGKLKASTSAPAPTASTSSTPKQSTPTASPSPKKPTVSDFEKTFRPFVVKKDTTMAPTNWFQESRKRRRKQDDDVIVLDSDSVIEIEDSDVEMIDDPFISSLEERNPPDLKSVIASLPPPLDARRHPRRKTSSYKTYHPEPVRSIITRLTEAEVTDDATTVRRLLSDLRNRNKLPVKALMFHEDVRPGYYGTFTRRSQFVGPRTPFGRDDVAVDYSYDSEAEWEGEEEGGGDDVANGSDEEKEESDSEDDELKGWLVDDDEEEVVTPIEERDGLEEFPFLLLGDSASKGKRKAVEQEKPKKDNGTKVKKRKVEVALIPYTKGPCWESHIGESEFSQYRIHLFNDTPYPINPFMFVSQPLEAHRPHTTPKASSSSTLAPSTSAPQFAVPALPAHVIQTAHINPNPNLNSPVPSSSSAPNLTPKKPPAPPKHPFPDAHLSLLLSKIDSLATGSLPALVDSVYQELKVHKVKKNAIEVKVKEVAQKDGRKVWIVRPEFAVSSFLSVLGCGWLGD
ncbi:uncharacterized protein STEHIDRAFT_119429 [Stereum hirsutum FP-91666 SS1]|uniref:uncharacterized protein n=1 Tax=Stereum hirsutum (strain FP-91666) TaxID=721885 RepID=UPI000440D2F4|nr:uncharacterized protein STEHIDRAFT_119429 [Stereum hirsutum FP-91666 SS1]EIM90432.1 hypothetical protein STEHIDRAFT_119429 [Stereum hirsutum FP-91666 SS1]